MMIRRRQLAPHDLVVAFRLDGDSRRRQDLYHAAEELLSLWERELASCPLTWIGVSQKVPVPADTGWDTLVTEIKARIRRRGDATATAGHADAPHLLLTNEELSRELRWARRNRWHTGIEDVFGVACDVLLPSSPGPWGPLATAARAAGFRWLGMAGPYDARREPASISTFLHFAAASLPVSETRSARRYLPEALAAEMAAQAAAVSRGRAMLLIEPADVAALPAIVAAVADLAAIGGRLVTLANVPPDRDDSSIGGEQASRVVADNSLVPTTLGCSPPSLARWSAAATLRPARRVERCDRLLSLFAGRDETSSAGPQPPATCDRTLTASMPGQASLVAVGVEAEFVDGRLCHLRFAGAESAIVRPVRSYVTTAHGAVSFESVSAFAFDGGLRELLALPDAGMTLSVDYLLAAAGALAVQVSLRCDAEPAQLRRVVPIALPLHIETPGGVALSTTASWGRSIGHPIWLAPGHATAGASIEIGGSSVDRLVLTRLDNPGRDTCLARLELTFAHGRHPRRHRKSRRSLVELQLMPSEESAAGQFEGRAMTFALAISDRALSSTEASQVGTELLESTAEGSSRPE